MILWRISRFIDLKGIGGLQASGRWHEQGHPVVYLAESPAGALLEVCAHTSSDDVPPNYTLLRIEGPDVSCPVIALGSLPQDWTLKPEITRQQGNRWLHDCATVCLKVPSAIVPHTSNYLFNPLHPKAKLFTIAESYRYPFDGRLKL